MSQLDGRHVAPLPHSAVDMAGDTMQRATIDCISKTLPPQLASQAALEQSDDATQCHGRRQISINGNARWAEARIKITRMTLTIKRDRNWNSFQLANSAPPLSVTGSAIAPSARMHERVGDLAPSAVESHKPPASLPKRGSGRDACGSASVDTPTTSSCYP